METYNYLDHEVEDVKEYIKTRRFMYEDPILKDKQTLYDLAEENRDVLYDDMFTDDDVTGNFSSSYTFNKWQAENNLNANYALIVHALDHFDCDYKKAFHDGPESIDVIIRCYLLSEALDVAINDFKDEITDFN